MPSILRFSDLECLNESASGSLGAGLAVFARAEFPTIRGFVVTPIVFSEFLRKPEIVAAVDLYRSGAEDPKESWRSVKAVFRRARIQWSQEMDILGAFSELGSVASVVTTSKFGAGASPVYAHSGNDLLDGIKHCWLKWLKGNLDKLEQQDMPSVIVREVFDTETSLELRKKNNNLVARAVFGLPEGLNDPAVSGDIYEFKPDGELERMEQRQQRFQYVMRGQGPVRTELDQDFQDEEKATGEMLESLMPFMVFMHENASLERCGICFVDSRPVIYSAMLVSEPEGIVELPQREGTISLMEEKKRMPSPAASPHHGPVVATRLLLDIRDSNDLERLADEFAQGALFSKDITPDEVVELAAEAKRRLGTRQAILELGTEEHSELARMVRDIIELDMEPGILIPGIRSGQELARIIRELDLALEGLSPRPRYWARIMYPSNLFFMDSLSGKVDVLALDLDMLGRLMLGGGEDGHWLIFSHDALEKALAEALESCPDCKMAVISEDLVAMPSLLEFLIRQGVQTLIVKPGDLPTIRHIAASVERRMLLESGRQ